jgi:hypothetical protein
MRIKPSLLGLVLVAGCGTVAPQPDMLASTEDLASTAGLDLTMSSNGCTHVVECTDQSIQQLPLFRPVNTATITNMSASNVYTSNIDATAGATGGQITPTKSFVYAKFTDQGLVRVDVGDEDALASSDWHIAFRRFVIRLNSGISGPSCTKGARTAANTMFDGLSTVPTNLSLTSEDYFSESCDYLADTFGLNSPLTTLASFWAYPDGCVKMTGNVFVVKLPDGKHVKLQVLSYYSPSVQMACDTTGMITSPSGSGNFVVKWAFLP